VPQARSESNSHSHELSTCPLPPSMAKYIRSWFPASTPPVPEITQSEPEDDDDMTIKADDDDNDEPPAFPSLNSAQRSSTASMPPSILIDNQLMPPPPAPSLARRQLGAPVPRSSASLLALPPSTTKIPSKSSKRAKVALAPGHGALDWANLKSSGQDLRVS